jgi:hypothetical protein
MSMISMEILIISTSLADPNFSLRISLNRVKEISETENNKNSRGQLAQMFPEAQ